MKYFMAISRGWGNFLIPKSYNQNQATKKGGQVNMKGPFKLNRGIAFAAALALTAGIASGQQEPPEQQESYGPIPYAEGDAQEPSSLSEEAAPQPVLDQTPEASQGNLVAEPAAKQQKQQSQPSFSLLDIDVKGGFAAGLGLSAFAGHKAFAPDNFPQAGGYTPMLGAWVSTGIGLAAVADITDLVSIAAELRYSLYTSRGSFRYDANTEVQGLAESSVELHSVELPILARFNLLDLGALDFNLGIVDLGFLFVDVGPVFGANLFAKGKAGSFDKAPDRNGFAFGPAAGAGVYLNNGAASIGVRGFFNVVEYAENTGGYPWAVQLAAALYVF